MPLHFPPDRVVYIPGKNCILIAAEEHGRPVLCYVTRGGMIAAGASAFADAAMLLAFFETHRKEFETALGAAYEAAPSHTVMLDVSEILKFGGSLRP
jgi:hypothetical protein